MALASAVRDACAEAGITQRELGAAVARAEGRAEPYTQAFVSDWMAGRRPLDPDRIFTIERVCGLRPGTLSAIVGFVPIGTRAVVPVPEAVAADVGLTPEQREDLVAQWEGMRARTAERRRRRQQRAGP